ncbi:unnamed protein product, partial [Gulo gulo]
MAPGALWPVSSASLLSPPTGGQGPPVVLDVQECSGAGQWVRRTLQLWRNSSLGAGWWVRIRQPLLPEFAPP